MGRGNSGLFHGTIGARKYRAISLTSVFVGKGPGENLRFAAKWVKEENGFSDVVIHGASNYVAIWHNAVEQKLSQRELAKMIKRNPEYHGGPIRLLSCGTGKDKYGFAQNLANKLGVPVKAPSDTLWILPSGRMVIGKNQYNDTGRWITYYPGGNRK